MDYISDRYQSMQVDDKHFDYLLVTHRNLQGSILGSVLFNIYVSDTSEHTPGTCLEYIEDTSLYYHTTVNDLDTFVKQVNDKPCESFGSQ